MDARLIEMEGYQPCSETTVCPAMAERIQDSGKKGIVSWNIINQNAEHVTSIIGYKSSANDRGLVFNYCPWCGHDFRKSNPILKRKENQ